MIELPAPLTPADCDCTDLDSFMLNAEKLMGSELVALSSHEVIAAALFLWCRAWKQRPAASLPDDDRVMSAFAKLPMKRFKSLKQDILRGFVKCADGRLYHRTLSAEAVKAFEKKLAFQRKRNSDNERLKKWRATHQGNTQETQVETTNETHFVAEGQVRDSTGKGQEVSTVEAKASTGAERPVDLVLAAGKPEWWPDRDRYGRVLGEVTEKIMFDVGKAVLGKSAGGQVTKLRKLYRGDMRAVTDFLLQAEEKSDAGEWFAGVIKRAEIDEHQDPKHVIYPEKEYRV